MGSCSGRTGPSLVQCVGLAAITGASSGFGAWPVGSDALYRPVDIRPAGAYSDYIYDNSVAPGAAYSYHIPLQTMFAPTGGTYDNLAKLATSGTTYVFYNRTPHTALSAAMGARMLGYPTIGLRFGHPHWNNTVVEKWTASIGGTFMATTTSASNVYRGPISTLHPSGSDLNLAPTIISGPTVMGNVDALNSVKIKWDTDYPATTMLNDKDTYNDTVLDTSHSVTLSGLSLGTYTHKAISYDCVANNTDPNNIGTGTFTFIFADVNVMPTTLNTNSKGDYVTAVIKLPAGYDCTMVDISTVKLQGTLPVVAVSGSCTTVDDRATVKFNRAAVAGIVSPGSNIMVVEGSTFDGTPIVGSDIMNVL
jgi:hypothetical protein